MWIPPWLKVKTLEDRCAAPVGRPVAGSGTLHWTLRGPVTGSGTLNWTLRVPVTGSGTLHWTLGGPVTGCGTLHWTWRSYMELDVISYSAAIRTCEKGRQCEQALSLLQEMRRSRLQLDVISYSAAISAGSKGQLCNAPWGCWRRCSRGEFGQT